MKNKRYLLSIDKPCKKEWTSMSQSDDGRFCSHCSKSVVDFTQLTDSQVVKIIEQNSGKLCGRLSQEQLKRTIQIYQPKNTARLYKILAGVFLFGISKNSLALNLKNFERGSVSIIDNKLTNTHLSKNKSDLAKDSLKNVVQGLVIDSETNMPLVFASVFIKDKKILTSTDMYGKFTLVIPDSLLTRKMYLDIRFIGYEPITVLINKKDLPISNHTFLVKVQRELLGEVIIVSKKKKWWQ
jgi:CarboxypepD_reg-like domain